VLATLHALGADAMRCLPGLARVSAPVGRGARTLLDVPRRPDPADRRELQCQPGLDASGAGGDGRGPREAFPRRVAVLGDMLELGDARPSCTARSRKRLTQPASIWFLPVVP
jgi:UDP-N-acetylmuramoyl-tripeptide--D-alanyl-D-alanine ligase